MNKLNFFLISLIFYFVTTITTQGEEKKIYRLGVEELNYLPHYSYTEKYEYFGFARELFDKFSDVSGIEFSYEVRPVPRLFTEFYERRSLDFKYPANIYWQAERKKGISVIYSQPVVGFIDGMMVRPDKKNKGVNNLQIVGTAAGFTPWPYLDRIKSGNILLETNISFPGLLNQVIRSRVDAAYINIAVSEYYLAHEIKDPTALVFDRSLPFVKDSFFMASIKYPKVIISFNKFLSKYKNWIQQLKSKHKVELKLDE